MSRFNLAKRIEIPANLPPVAKAGRYALRGLIWVYEQAASLKLAVFLIFLSAAVLAYGTMIEAAYGTPVVQYCVYRTWWFSTVYVLLAVNIFCAASIRYPWKRHQTGFVITHIGLLTLLYGSALGRIYGIDSQIPIHEGLANNWAVENGELVFQLRVDKPDGESQTLTVPFHAGPINWRDYNGTEDHEGMFPFETAKEAKEAEADDFTLGDSINQWFQKMARWGTGRIFNISRRSGQGDVLYDRDGIKLEVLDYFSSGRLEARPAITLMTGILDPRIKLDKATGKELPRKMMWSEIPLSVQMTSKKIAAEYPFGLGEQIRAGGGNFSFWLAGTAGATEAFQKCVPDRAMADKERLVIIYTQGKRFEFAVDDFLKGAPLPLTGTDLSLNSVKIYADAIELSVQRNGQQIDSMLIQSDAPHLNQQANKSQVYGDLWIHHGEVSQQDRMAGKGFARVDIIQSNDGKHLYYRRWDHTNRKVTVGELPTHGDEQNTVDLPMAGNTLKLYVKAFHPSLEPDYFATPKPFVREAKRAEDIQVPMAQVRLTVDGTSRDFWITSHSIAYRDQPDMLAFERQVRSDDRTVTLQMPSKSHDIGYRVRLDRFVQRLDPGTSQPSNYSSVVDFVMRDADSTLFSANLNGSQPGMLRAAELAIDDEQKPRAAMSVAYDAATKQLFWCDAANGQILRLKSGETEPSVIYGEIAPPVKLIRPVALALDSKRQQLYVADDQGKERAQIYRLSFAGKLDFEYVDVPGVSRDGRPRTGIFSPEIPTSMVFDASSETLYWVSHRSQSLSRIPSGEKPLRVDPMLKNMKAPFGLALDETNQRLYWTEQRSGEIKSLDLKSADAEPKLVYKKTDPHEMPAGLAIDPQEKKLYWSDAAPHPSSDPDLPLEKRGTWDSRIRSADLDGKNVQDLVTAGVDRPAALAIDTAEGRIVWCQSATYRSNVWITMNAPVEFSNPRNSESYRLFQESFNGPFKPGDPTFERFVSADQRKNDLYISHLSVNYDPGRGLRNTGCFLVVVGIFTMFYMRAYFFKSKSRVEAAQPSTAKLSGNPSSARQAAKVKS